MAVKSIRRGLNRETRALLEYVRRVRPANRAYGLPAEVARAQAHGVVDRIVQSSGLAHVIVDELRWLVDDVARALCSGQGEELAFELDGVLGKWLGFDLEPNTVQLLLRILLREVAGIEVRDEQPHCPTGAAEAKSEVRDQNAEGRSNGLEKAKSGAEMESHHQGIKARSGQASDSAESRNQKSEVRTGES